MEPNNRDSKETIPTFSTDKSETPRNIDKYFLSDEKIERPRKKLTKSQKALAAVAAFLIFGGIGGGIAANVTIQNRPAAAVSDFPPPAPGGRFLTNVQSQAGR